MLQRNINNSVQKTKGNIMNLLNRIKSLFSAKDVYENRLEAFLQTKNPTTVAELEHWITHYQRQGGGVL